MTNHETINAETGRFEQGPVPVPVQHFSQAATIPSMINIPPQIAVTAFWVMLGIGIGWWVFGRHTKTA